MINSDEEGFLAYTEIHPNMREHGMLNPSSQLVEVILKLVVQAKQSDCCSVLRFLYLNVPINTLKMSYENMTNPNKSVRTFQNAAWRKFQHCLFVLIDFLCVFTVSSFFFGM